MPLNIVETPSARLITLNLNLIIPVITKTSSNNCLLSIAYQHYSMSKSTDY